MFEYKEVPKEKKVKIIVVRLKKHGCMYRVGESQKEV